jgi:hypothetical protein
MSHHKFALLLLACGGAAGVSLGCDPAQDAIVQSLGPEAPGVPPGPTHRPGQPCLACHRDGGAGKPVFSIAGTIYREKAAPAAQGDVEVQLVDTAGTKLSARSNCAGNFYVTPAAFTPTFPVWVALRRGDNSIQMESPIPREGSCATCHRDPAGPDSAGPVYLTDEPDKAHLIAATPCPG